MFWKEFFTNVKIVLMGLLGLVVLYFALNYMLDSSYSFWGIICGIGGILVMAFGIPSFSKDDTSNTNTNNSHDTNFSNTFWSNFNHHPRDIRINLYNDYMKKR